MKLKKIQWQEFEIRKNEKAYSGTIQGSKVALIQQTHTQTSLKDKGKAIFQIQLFIDGICFAKLSADYQNGKNLEYAKNMASINLESKVTYEKQQFDLKYKKFMNCK